MTFKEAVEFSVQLMDEVPLKGSDSRARGIAQAELLKAIPIIEAVLKRQAKK